MAIDIISTDDVLKILEDVNVDDSFEIVAEGGYSDSPSELAKLEQALKGITKQKAEQRENAKDKLTEILVDNLYAQIATLKEEIEFLRDDSKLKAQLTSVLREMYSPKRKTLRFNDVVETNESLVDIAHDASIKENEGLNQHNNRNLFSIDAYSPLTLNTDTNSFNINEFTDNVNDVADVKTSKLILLPSEVALPVKSIKSILKRCKHSPTCNQATGNRNQATDSPTTSAIDIEDIEVTEAPLNEITKKTIKLKSIRRYSLPDRLLSLSNRLPSLAFGRKERKLRHLEPLLGNIMKNTARDILMPLGLEGYFNEGVVEKRNLLLDYQHDKELPETETMINDSWQKIIVITVSLALLLLTLCILPLFLLQRPS